MVKDVNPHPDNLVEHYRAAARRHRIVAQQYRRQRDDLRHTNLGHQQWTTALHRSWRHERYERIIWENRSHRHVETIIDLLEYIRATGREENNANTANNATEANDDESDSEDESARPVFINVPVNINFSNIRINL